VDWNDEAWPERESSQPVPYDAAVEAERRDRVQSALRALSERERRPIELSFYAGLSHREIAERLVLPLGTVKTRIRQGLIRLRGLFQNDGRPL
jgi:RNA polymerase sigma-70 factor (ECF subfamily)